MLPGSLLVFMCTFSSVDRSYAIGAGPRVTEGRGRSALLSRGNLKISIAAGGVQVAAPRIFLCAMRGPSFVVLVSQRVDMSTYSPVDRLLPLGVLPRETGGREIIVLLSREN